MKGRASARVRAVARAACAILLAPIVALLVAAVMTPLPPELADTARYSASLRFFDRDGALLREIRADDSARARWVTLDEVGPQATRALLAAEDGRFAMHPGVDPFALVRAVAAGVAHGRATSGASTITMQLARLVRPHRRTLLGKLGEMALALRIEASLSKRKVLEEYANRAPFGPGLRGIDAASRYWLDKAPNDLSLAEAATLAAIPRGPDLYAIDRHPDHVLRRRDRILARLRAAGWITEDERARAVNEPLAVHKARGTFGAPHLVQALYDGSLDPRLPAMRGEAEAVTTTIARELQREAENAAVVTLRPLARRHVSGASVVVLDNASGEILAYVGSPDFGDAANGGQNDGVRARRQPGSTLKPFVYGLAMERLGMTAASVLPDVELHLPAAGPGGGIYTPLDYDERYHGPVRLREALANSLNVPAVWTADRVGPASVLARLHEVGFASLREPAEYYGPAIALGDGEVTLLELANSYATIARGGVWKPVTAVREVRAKSGGAIRVGAAAEDARVMPREVASVLADVLADKDARLASFGERSALELPFAVAAKTGTSKGYRDNWTVGFTREVTVAVWVGNFDGTPMERVSGITGAAPLFRAVMEAAMRGRQAAPFAIDASLVRVAVCPLSGGAPTAACPHAAQEWVPAGTRLAACAMHETVAIDRLTGSRAGPACRAADVTRRTFERFPAEYAAWAKSAHREVAPEAWSTACPAGSRGEQGAGGVAVAWPHDGARFLVDPGRPRSQQAIAVRVLAPPGASRVVVKVDGAIAGTVSSPWIARWTLAEGDHVLVAEAPGLAPSEPVRVHVE